MVVILLFAEPLKLLHGQTTVEIKILTCEFYRKSLITEIMGSKYRP